MTKTSNRARVIYQSEALYIGTTDATGHHYATADDWRQGYNAVGRKTHATYQEVEDHIVSNPSHIVRTGVHQLRRVQSANYSFSINRQDVNQFGQLARIDSVAVEPPTVSLDFSYYLTNGINERLLGFGVTGQTNALTDEVLLGKIDEDGHPVGKNFFILTTPEGKDAVGSKNHDTSIVTEEGLGNSVIALGNGFVSNYSIEASVGGMPTANVTIDGLNLRTYNGTHKLPSPAINTIYGNEVDGVEFSLPPAVSGKGEAGIGPDEIWGSIDDFSDGTYFGNNEGTEDEGLACLRPGDITLSLGTDGIAGGFQNLPKDDPRLENHDPSKDYSDGSAHIQSFSIDVPINRSVIQRLGNTYGYSRVTDFPINISVSVNAILSDLKSGNVADMLFDEEEHDLMFTMREPTQSGNGPIALQYMIKGARLEGESFSSSIGDNKSVDITFTAQVGGPEDLNNGIFISGSRNATGIHQYFA